jgi:hypothetical protein
LLTSVCADMKRLRLQLLQLLQVFQLLQILLTLTQLCRMSLLKKKSPLNLIDDRLL